MHSDKSNTFYLEHAEGAHLFELHQEVSAQIDLEKVKNLNDWVLSPSNHSSDNYHK